jgi:hypothetical protein
MREEAARVDVARVSYWNRKAEQDAPPLSLTSTRENRKKEEEKVYPRA